MSQEDWFGVLSCLFSTHVGNNGNVDEEAWMDDYNQGKSPHDAFYDEYPEYIGLED